MSNYLLRRTPPVWHICGNKSAQKVFKKVQKLERIKVKRENETGGGPLQSIKIDTLAWATSFCIVFSNGS